MKPLFTLHAGEYLVGAFIEKHFKKLNVWIPARDSGIDFLVSDRGNRRSISFQVKFSKDFLVTHMGPAFQQRLRACGWWAIGREKLRASPADYWVFVLQGFANQSVDFVVVPRRELVRLFSAIHGRAKTIQSYIWVTQAERCWETRGLKKDDQLLIASNDFRHLKRDLTRWLNNWTPLRKLSR
jgi:hypothetical protein